MFSHLQIDRPRKLVGFFNEPVIFHCHHYNLFLQQTIEDPDWIDGVSILQISAQEIFYSLLKNAFVTLGIETAAERLATAARMFSFLGFGQLNFEVTEGGGIGQLPLCHGLAREVWRAGEPH